MELTDLQLRLLKTIKGKICTELEKYDQLPFDLAFLYLICGKPKTEIRYKENYYWYDPPINININPLLSNAVLEEGLCYRHQHSSMQYQLDNPFSDTLKHLSSDDTIFWRGTKIDSVIINYKKSIYERNKNLKEAINIIVNLYNKTENGIPKWLVYPYLRFNRTSELWGLDRYKNTTDLITTYNSIRWDNQKKTIKLKFVSPTSNVIEQYTVFKPSELLFLYRNPLTPLHYSWVSDLFSGRLFILPRVKRSSILSSTADLYEKA